MNTKQITLLNLNKPEKSQNFESRINNQGTCDNGNSLVSLQNLIASKTGYKKQSMPAVVLAHGYGCAGGVFLPSITNIYSTISKYNSDAANVPNIHIIDWLGNGLSSRPKFNCKTTAETEEFYVESLEQWRKSMGLKKMILCAHSLGAYCSILYAIKYPQNIDHLVLISPVGLPEKPEEYDRGLVDNPKIPFYIKLMIRFFTKLWEYGFTPSDIIRGLGPKGKDFLQWAVDKRLFRLNGDDHDTKRLKELLSEYLYHILAMNGGGSGEYALNKILLPGAWAVNPLCKRMGPLKELQKKYGFDIDFIYGSNDWMKSENALQLKQDDIFDCNVHIVNKCGHQMLLENYKDFGEMLGTVIVNGQLV